MGLPEQVAEEGRFPRLRRAGKDDRGKLSRRLSDNRLQGSVDVRHGSPRILLACNYAS